MNTFDPLKPVQTRDGRPAEIICRDIREYPTSNEGHLVAKIEDKHILFFDNGFVHRHRQSDSDLINIPEAPKWRAWNNSKEVPVGALIDVWTKDQSAPSVILSTEHSLIVVAGKRELVNLTFAECFRDGKVSRDMGKTWEIAGIQS